MESLWRIAAVLILVKEQGIDCVCKLSTFVQCCDDVILILVWGIFFFVDVIEVCEDCVTNLDFNDNS